MGTGDGSPGSSSGRRGRCGLVLGPCFDWLSVPAWPVGLRAVLPGHDDGVAVMMMVIIDNGDDHIEDYDHIHKPASLSTKNTFTNFTCFFFVFVRLLHVIMIIIE